ncbi:hypothetical protein C8R47DRAFT_1068054 [Mycena vitilis]|nr:hypothetical protein C8R47DRAFT_1068054 [Mycena vitilis]
MLPPYQAPRRAATPHDRMWRDTQRECLATLDTSIADWGAEIGPEELRRMKDDRTRLEAIVFSFQYAAGPDVPVEILSHIFTLCLPADGRVRPSPLSAPLLLTQVCRGWRERAIATVQLWGALHFTFSNRENTRKHERARQLLQTWFTRARGYPLSMTLHSTWPRRLPSFVLDAISTFGPQLQRLEIAMPSSAYRAFHLAPGWFPVLTDLFLRAVTVSTDGYSTQRILTAFGDAPRLQNVRLLTGCDLANVSISADARLTSLEIEREISATTVTAILNRFPKLAHLKVTLDALSVLLSIQYIDYPPPLESLDSNAPALCDALTLPHLQRLRCTLSERAHAISLDAFISRSACLLRELTIRIDAIEDYVIDDYELAKLLAKTPSVETLDIDYSRQTLPTSRGIYTHLKSCSLLPYLNTLSVIENLAEGPYYYGALVSMLQKRRREARRGPRGLRTFELTLRPSGVLVPERVVPNTMLSAQIDLLIQRGLNFRVKSCELDWPIRSPAWCVVFSLYGMIDRSCTSFRDSSSWPKEEKAAS